MTGNIMIQGTTSDAGKSIVVAGLCRILFQDGLKVVPFKSQNMALNSYITATGKEMGRAQVFQAEAAMIEPDVRMNPVLLKPTSDRKSQVIFNGEVLADMDAAEYHEFKPQLVERIRHLYREISAENDVVVIEGAGSPAEINLNSRDIANMGMAKIADAPVIIVADIDRGGVFASIYGTIELLQPEERQRVKGIIINKFRGDKSLLDSGLQMIEELTGVPVIGVIPYLSLAIDDEDSMALNKVNRRFNEAKAIDVAVVCLSKISNFTDFNSLEMESDVSVRYVFSKEEMGLPDLLIIPGSKNTAVDNLYLQDTGLDKEILKVRDAGKTIIGICGGYQILGTKLHDPEQIESSYGTLPGLGILKTETYFKENKTTTQVVAIADETPLRGYEIHMGETVLNGESPFAQIIEENGSPCQRFDGAVSEDGRVIGTYLHGLFDDSQWRHQFFNRLRQRKGLATHQERAPSYDDFKNNEYDKLAATLRQHLDMTKIYQIIDGKG